MLLLLLLLLLLHIHGVPWNELTCVLCIYVDDLESRRDVPWGELVDEAESRTPGRVVHVHEKLSSPSRKR